ncbi:Dimethyl sulfoxide reductase DmsA [Moorella thermoacetica]|uniref:DMSO/selenate family reductase complex A subunit n=1 Tax=Neomoorella thermoacetica TaxID=1525 RepID=UPI0008FB66C9|nr:DMSO/selenate family reductase complex A subunit [Moorella thermoacetica]OIQ61354.1 dimethyl sulfoxide reductase DmsA precursor [Moorella thermoacetica]
MAEDTKLWLKPISRRKFLTLSMAAAGGVAALTTLMWEKKAGAVASGATGATGETIIPTSCVHNCGGRCPLYAHVKDGVVTWFSPDQEGNDSPDFPQVRACLRGRSQRKRLYHPDRLKYPMKRVGKRGEGKFERISWDEALDTIARELQRIKSNYGNEAIYINYATGVYGQVSQSWITPAFGGALPRFLNMFGGYLGYYNTYSSACFSYAAPYTFGTVEGNSPDDLLNSKLIVLFADNPGETRLGGANGHYYLRLAKEKGARVIVVDPRYTDTAVTLADEWIPIRPTTDNALIDALAYVMINENLHDQAFLDKYCLGFDEEHMPPGIPPGNSYKSYVLGQGEDKTPKTPEWAEAITGVPRDTIIKLARQIASIKPCCLLQGFGWQRHAYGEQPVRGLPVLAAMTGNIGIRGGGPGLRNGGHGVVVGWMPAGQNPVKASIPCFMWPEAIERGHELTAADGVKGVDKLSTDIKMIWNYGGNTLINQHSDINKTAKILADEKKCEFILVHDVFMTPSARFADILLPDVTHFEREDIVTFASGIGYAIYHQKVVDPMYECRSLYDVCSELAKRLGFGDQYTEGKSEQDWLREAVNVARQKDPNFPSFEEFRRKGIYKIASKDPIVAYEKQIKDPANNPFQTPSGKIEIFSTRLWAMNNPKEIPAIPKYIPAWEGPQDPLRAKYPLQCIGPHYKRRVHSTFDNVPWLEEASPQEMWINPRDAAERGLKDGDKARVFNDRGELIIPVKVTPRIMPGVVAIPQGAWWTPDSNGVDQRGCINTLTKYHPTPLAHGNPQHTNLVQVAKA